MNRTRKNSMILMISCLAMALSLTVTMTAFCAETNDETGLEIAAATSPVNTAGTSNIASMAITSQDSNRVRDISPKRMALDRNTDGCVLRSLTIEGDDKVSISFERPGIVLDLQPRNAPGLGWKNTWEKVDLFPVVTSFSALEQSPYLGCPWMDGFAAGDVVVFRPMIEQAHHWQLTVVDSRGRPAISYEGKGQPPETIAWDGRRSNGSPAWPGLIYTHVLETRDKAGNLRTYTGEGFELPPYRLMREDGIQLVMAGELFTESANDRGSDGSPTADLIREAASWLNQIEGIEGEIEINVTARTKGQARRLADTVARSLDGKVIGRPYRIGTTADVVADAPDNGMVIIATK
ncbi:MAG: hypothetical protein KOO60_06890 [Gemmatimonadales bacterium]|nr:hypothetical protein [Gemmatimonadales bacterium]